ncbi:DNA polymerase III subunit gamma/tau [Verrucomicrobiota bacterium]
MSYEVIARKYRPQQFDEVVGQEHVVKTLSNAITSGRVAHAYLFVGSRGIGKTTSARIFAKALNCKDGSTPTPCDQCDSCKEIMGGRSLDVIEIDGASNNGVDQIRELRDNAIYSPARDRFKIYLIDEVHMLSIAAFNALLKTLEEPPSHVKFLFATTDPQKIPNTILSRCQRFDLRRITTGDIMGQLQKICDSEKVEIDEPALLAIARGAEGGMRDAESALDQLIAFRGDKLTEEDVLSVFGLVSQQTLDDLVGAVLEGNIAEIIRVISDLDRQGKDVQRLVVELLEYFRNLLVVMHVGASGEGVQLLDSQVESLKALAAKTDTERVLRIVDILIKADGSMRYALSKRTMLETALIRASRAATVVSVDDLLKQIADLKKNGLADDEPAPAVAAAGKKSFERSAPARVAESAPVAPVSKPAAPPASPEPEDPAFRASDKLRKWRDDPSVSKLIETFSARIVDVKE